MVNELYETDVECRLIFKCKESSHYENQEDGNKVWNFNSDKSSPKKSGKILKLKMIFGQCQGNYKSGYHEKNKHAIHAEPPHLMNKAIGRKQLASKIFVTGKMEKAHQCSS